MSSCFCQHHNNHNGGLLVYVLTRVLMEAVQVEKMMEISTEKTAADLYFLLFKLQIVIVLAFPGV